VKKIPLIYAIPAGIALVLAVLLALGLTSVIENRVYDVFLSWHPSPPEDKSIVFVKVDDDAVSTVGTWPISRSITADGLLLLKEMGARYAVFDIEYVNKSPRGVNASVLEETFPALLKEGFGKLADNNTEMARALKSRQFPLSEAPSLAKDFRAAAEAQSTDLVANLKKIAIDNDQRLAQASTLFGKSYLTIRMLVGPDSSVTDSIRTIARDRFATPSVSGLDHLKAFPDISPTIDPILSSAQGLGFTNVDVDLDGVRRRIDLLKVNAGQAYGQLAFTPFLDVVGHPAIEVRPDAYVLKGAHYPDGKTYDVTIPRAQDGSVLINWPHTPFNDSFHHLSFNFLYQHDRLFDDLVNNIKARDSWGYLSKTEEGAGLLAEGQALQTLRADLLEGNAPASVLDDYRSARTEFLRKVGAYLDAKPDEAMLAELGQVLADPTLSGDQKADYQTIQKDMPDWFARTRDLYVNLMEIRTNPHKLGNLTGAFCILGNTNTGSTDLGVTPFESHYPNVGTHASVLNMLLQRSFVVDASPWWSWLIGLVGALALTYFLKGKKPVISLSVGGGVSVAAVAVFVILFAATGLYLPVLPMASLMILTFFGTTFFQFLSTEKEKGFLRNAFSRYLSNEVIQQIIANPDQLKLGGQQKVMTAMFTDIKGFSTISEKMTPEELVLLLNQYLTSMSDLILDLGGTIDKYEGDAIIAFFGAPLDLPDHARRACLAAVRMKRVEEDLNQRFLEEKATPLPLLTRIGINTGPMVVGNMGTNRKMDYTIIGDSVNLAARLEGVNKLYGTWILISEDTKELVGDVIVTRKLDRVRVVGKNVPIRLFQAVEEKGHLAPGLDVLLDTYHRALDAFEERRWTEARVGFAQCLELEPNDGPSQRYLKLAQDYEKTPPPESWDGVFKMETK